MKRNFVLLYGITAYILFVGTILYAIGFVGNLVVSKTIDGSPAIPPSQAGLVNASLLLLFALQHSIMARPFFKRWLLQFVPEPIERSTFVFLASLCFLFMIWQWQPMGGIIWSLKNKVAVAVLTGLFFLGWSIVFISTFLINHFDLFGLRQVWLYFRRKKYELLSFRIPVFYRFVRHPLYLGFLIAFWSTPVMTVAHLFFAALTTGYILTAIRFEEKDLITHFGERYVNYKKWVPKIIPFTKRDTAQK